MSSNNRPTNRLIKEKSPYLLQHAYNPVDWYAWDKEAFTKATQEDKPIFLSIGYSTCHWCHVMEQESFEDQEVADILNENYVCIKVDKEERPDIDSIYMNVCIELTGSGGWPLTIIMTPNQRPFFAGTYFPKQSQHNSMGLIHILLTVSKKWKSDKQILIDSSTEIVNILKQEKFVDKTDTINDTLIDQTVSLFKHAFDSTYGGFGSAPKFPTPHHMLFLLQYYETNKDTACLEIVEKTLLQMYKGGIFDHIGFGFSRYSTDDFWLVPHFEKMLYDNALLTIAYLETFDKTQKEVYKNVATKVMDYVLRELTSDEGGFYCAQDADSDGVEGKYYVFTPDEIISLLGKEDGNLFNQYFDITENGNFEGKSIPNLINNDTFDPRIEKLLPIVYAYRKNREALHKDDKILTSWNALMISAFAKAYHILKDKKYLNVAKKAIAFIEQYVMDNNHLYVSYRDGQKSDIGFLDDYAFYIYALINMYEATLNKDYIQKAIALNDIVMTTFYDEENGGFFLTSNESEPLILRPKETYDGAIPSGNSIMSYNLLMLSNITKDNNLYSLVKKQFNYMSNVAENHPAGYSFFMLSLVLYRYPPKEIICVLKDKEDKEDILFPKNAMITILESETKEYPLKNDKTTFYICKDKHCLPPTNTLSDLYK